MKVCRRLIIPLLGAAVGLTTPLFAATEWTGTIDGNWNAASAGNWTNGNPSQISGSPTDVVTFGNSTRTSVTPSGDFFMTQIVFTAAASNYTFNDSLNVLYLQGTGAGITVNGGRQIINKQIRPFSAISIINNTSQLLTLSHSEAAILSPTSTTVTFGGVGDIEVNRIARRNDAVNFNILKQDSGTLTISSYFPTAAGNNITGMLTGTTTINGGKVRINDERNIGANPTAFSASHLTLNGGTLGAFGTFTIDDANRGITLGASGGTFDVEGINILTVSNVVTGTGTLNKTGTGTIVADRSNTYSGTTTLSSGTFLANNTSGSATGTGNVVTSLNSNAKIGGTGSITGGSAASISLNAGTFLMVGNTHGVASGSTSGGFLSEVADFDLGSSNNVAITLGGTLQFDLFANTSGTPTAEADLLKLSTTASSIPLGGLISVANVSGAAAGSWTEGTWKLIDWTGIGSASKSGAFTFDLPTLALASGYTWSTASFLNDGTISIVAVPEPSRALFLSLGFGWLIFRRRVQQH